MSRRVVIVVSSVLLSLGLSGCLFFGFATVGGTLTGLPSGTSVTLQNNGRDNLTLTQNGRFTFNNTLDDGDDYNVTVLTQPASANCTPSNNTGSINSKGDDVENVLVTCVASGNLTGTVSGLATGAFVRLSNGVAGSGAATLDVNANGNFAFSGTLANGTAYTVSVSQNPSGQTCSVTGASGTIQSNAPSTTIAVTCTP
ncbi:hypothetical protein LRS03_24095 [Rhizobacter sp. J219]|uniref:hypothetical protein n=1 Tax=Rhizobacter sp. J219 TaxID=2898430 RepID=UPI002151AD91|nr:hypothetical protein [Rhizobacter sp. J219]MCR5885771.1 hypothetical protein [Rhizobacter sp. J219]